MTVVDRERRSAWFDRQPVLTCLTYALAILAGFLIAMAILQRWELRFAVIYGPLLWLLNVTAYFVRRHRRLYG